MSNSSQYDPVVTEYLEVLKRHNEEEILAYLQTNFEKIQEEVGGQGKEYPVLMAMHRALPISLESVNIIKINNILFKTSIHQLHNEGPHFFVDYINENKPILIDLLLRRGYNPNCPSRDGKLPLEAAIEKQNIPIINLLLGNPYTEIKESFLEKAAGSPEILELLQARKNSQLPQKQPVFLYQGHGGEICDRATGKLINKPVPDGSLYILSGICGAVTTINYDNILGMMRDKYDIILQNPVKFKKEIESALSRPTYEAKIVVYSPGMEFIDNKFFPAAIWKHAPLLRIKNSGLLEKSRAELDNIRPKDETIQTPLADFNELLPFFQGSVYPTAEEIQEKLGTLNPKPVWTYEETERFFFDLMKPTSEILSERPGIHFNLLCRSIDIKDESCRKATLARRISSVEERGRNIVQTLKQAYLSDDENTFKQFLIDNYDALVSSVTPRNIKILEARNTLNMSTKELKTLLLANLQKPIVFKRIMLFDSFKKGKIKAFVEFLRENKTFFSAILDDDLIRTYNLTLDSMPGPETFTKYMLLKELIKKDPIVFEIIYLYTFGTLSEMRVFMLLHLQALREKFTKKEFDFYSNLGVYPIQDKAEKDSKIKALIFGDLSAMRFSPGLPATRKMGGKRRKINKSKKNRKHKTSHKIRVRKV